jgi:hypothetical protein
MAHAAVAFTDQGTSIRERAKNIISPAVDHASHFEQLRFMREELKAEKDRLQLLLNLTTRVSPDVELRQLLRTASATIHHITQCAVVVFHFPDKENRSLRLFTLDTCNDGNQAVRQGNNSCEAACEAFRTKRLMLTREGAGYGSIWTSRVIRIVPERSYCAGESVYWKAPPKEWPFRLSDRTSKTAAAAESWIVISFLAHSRFQVELLQQCPPGRRVGDI